MLDFAHYFNRTSVPNPPEVGQDVSEVNCVREEEKEQKKKKQEEGEESFEEEEKRRRIERRE